MKVGDLVIFKPDKKLVTGTLTAVKYYERMRKLTEGLSGIVVHDHGTSVQVMFGNKLILLNKSHVEVINESRR